MKLDVARVGFELGSTLAEAHTQLTGSTWADDEFLQYCARLAWESEAGRQLSHHWWQGNNGGDSAVFARAYEEAYRSYQEESPLPYPEQQDAEAVLRS